MYNTVDMNGFSLGEPALVCRWRLSAGTLPLENRHLRALSNRTVNGKPVSAPLIAWVKQNVEWALKAGSVEYPDGVLMVLIDKQDYAAMTVGPYQQLDHITVGALANRARDAQNEALTTGVAPESLWVLKDSCLILGEPAQESPAGVTSLILHLTQTLGIPVEHRKNLIREVFSGAANLSGGVMLTSDEHGVLVASDAWSRSAEKLAGAYTELLEKARKSHP